MATLALDYPTWHRSRRCRVGVFQQLSSKEKVPEFGEIVSIYFYFNLILIFTLYKTNFCLTNFCLTDFCV